MIEQIQYIDQIVYYDIDIENRYEMQLIGLICIIILIDEDIDRIISDSDSGEVN